MPESAERETSPRLRATRAPASSAERALGATPAPALRPVPAAPATRPRARGRFTLLPPVWFALAAASMLALHFLVPLVQWNLGASRWWGLPFVAAGIALVQGGVRHFLARTTLHPFREPSVLVTTGWFAWSRNPMYTGLVLSLVGAAILLGSLSSSLCVPAFAALLRLRFIACEERALEARFGETYRAYRRQVRRWL